MSHIEDGFYKLDQERNYIHHGNNVYNAMYTLLRPEKDSYELPIDGWYWFDTPQAACEFFGVDIEEHDYLTYDPDHDENLNPGFNPEEGIDPHGI